MRRSKMDVLFKTPGDPEEEDQTEQIDDLLDDFVNPKKKEEVPAGDEPAEPEGEDVEEPEEDVSPNEPEPDEVKPEGKEGVKVEPEPDDDLMELSRKGLLKVIEKESLNIEVDDEASEEDVRVAVREARVELATDPERQIQDMREWMNQQAASFGQAPPQEGQPSPEGTPLPKGQTAPTPPSPVGMEPVKFDVTEEMFEEAMKGKEGFQKVIGDVLGIGEQRAMQRLSPMVAQMVQQQTALQTVITDFYTDNPDLRPYKPFVSFLANSISSQDPGKDFVSILSTVAQEARKRLRLPAVAGDTVEGEAPPKKVVKPSFAGGKHIKGNVRGRKAPPLKDQDRHMEDVLTADADDDAFGGRL